MDVLLAIAEGVRKELLLYLPDGIQAQVLARKRLDLGNQWRIELYYPSGNGLRKCSGVVHVQESSFYLMSGTSDPGSGCCMEMSNPDVTDYIVAWFLRMWREQDHACRSYQELDELD